MSPILVRPVREQLEHDRVIRLLQQDLAKKKVEVGINPGAEQNASVSGAGRKEFPDAVLYSTDKGKKLIGVVEVETAESVNHLEAMSQWAHLAKLRVPFHLYVPTGSVDVARRLSQDHSISVTEIWSYHQVGEQVKFTLIYPPNRGRSGASAPRTVSVASIRVEPRHDPTADEPEPKEAPAAGAARLDSQTSTAPRVVPAKPRVVPPKATAPKVTGAKVAAAPKMAPAKSTPLPVPLPVKAAKPAKPEKPVPPPKQPPPPKPAAPAKPAPKATGLAPKMKTVKATIVPPQRTTPRPATRTAAAVRPAAAAARPAARKAAPARAKGPVRPKAAARGAKPKAAPTRKPTSKRR